ncbi:MAG: hypothetical protein KGI91_16395 [Burkholderiales bacterium]|nr:hypothetical protein [Burkholderiales bacterium]
MKLWITTLLITLFMNGCATNFQRKSLGTFGVLQQTERVAYLDRLNAGKRYDELMLALFPDARHGGQVPLMNREEDEQDFFWLRGKTEYQFPFPPEFPLYYFFSWKLASPDPQASRLMNARGRVGLMLIRSLCAKSSQTSLQWNAMLEGGIFPNAQLRKGREWQEAVNWALDLHSKMMIPMDGNWDWYCGPGNSLGTTEAARRYYETLDKIQKSNLAEVK